MKRFFLLYVLPTLLLLGAATAPLISGARTLYLRDVLSSHYSLKASQALSLRQGEIPLVDLYRAGGQPLLGNPNVLPLYPDNLLYLFAHPLWALNAHFWLHLLLAPAAMFLLGRAWGLSRSAAWAAGVLYAGSGFFFSLFNLYNLVAGAALAPALAAAVMHAWRGASRRGLLAVGVLWALLLLAGDPLFAVLGLGLGISAALWRDRALPARPLRLGASLACGTALAAPMLVEFLRILPLSYRGYWNYTAEMALLHSWNPRTLVEWMLPLFFGRPDFDYWGFAYHDGVPPLFYSLFPGVLALMLALIALVDIVRGRGKDDDSRRVATWCALVVFGGVFLALGSHNPITVLLFKLPGMGLLRFPVKVWLIVAVALALLGGVGFERVQRLAAEGRRVLPAATAAAATLYFSAWIALNSGFAERLRGLDPRFFGPLFEPERLRWSGLCLLTLILLLLFAFSLRIGRRRVEVGGALLLALHLASQLFFLRPLYDSDEIEPYLARPELLDVIPEDALVVHGGFHDLFGAPRLDPLRADAIAFPDRRTNWLSRRHFEQAYPFSGIPWGRRYAFNNSPEGLDSFFSISLGRALKGLPDDARVRILAASGVDLLILDRELDPAARSLVELRERRPATGHDLFLYGIRDTAPAVAFAQQTVQAPQMNDALKTLASAAFDPHTMVVLPGSGAAQRTEPGSAERSGPGSARLVRSSPSEIVVEVDAPAAGVVVIQRAFLDLYRATVDGAPATVEAANIHRLGVRVPGGAQEIRVFLDRRPTAAAFVVALLGILGLAALLRFADSR